MVELTGTLKFVIESDPGMVTQFVPSPCCIELVCAWSSHPPLVGHPRFNVLPDTLIWIVPGSGLMRGGGTTRKLPVLPIKLGSEALLCRPGAAFVPFRVSTATVFVSELAKFRFTTALLPMVTTAVEAMSG